MYQSFKSCLHKSYAVMGENMHLSDSCFDCLWGYCSFFFTASSPMPLPLDDSLSSSLAVHAGAAVKKAFNKHCWTNFDIAMPKDAQQRKW